MYKDITYSSHVPIPYHIYFQYKQLYCGWCCCGYITSPYVFILIYQYPLCLLYWHNINHMIALPPIARFMGPTWAHLRPIGPRWAPCWPHGLCHLCQCQWQKPAGYWWNKPISDSDKMRQQSMNQVHNPWDVLYVVKIMGFSLVSSECSIVVNCTFTRIMSLD